MMMVHQSLRKSLKKRINALILIVCDQKVTGGVLVSASVNLFVLHIFSLILGFIINYVLVRLVPMSDYGWYVALTNILLLLHSFCLLGFDTLGVRLGAVYNRPFLYAKLKGLFYLSVSIAILGPLCISVLALHIPGLLNPLPAILRSNWLLTSIPMLIFLSFLTCSQAFLQGLRKIYQSQVAEKLVRPIVVLAGVALLSIRQQEISVLSLIVIQISAIGTAAALSFFLIKKKLTDLLKGVVANYDFKSWLLTGTSFCFISMLYALNSRLDILALSYLQNPADVGIYNVALKLSELLSIVLVTVNFVLAPLVASLQSRNQMFELQNLITQSARVVFVFTTILFLLFLMFRRPILLFFGHAFLHGETAFIILCTGQLANVLFGSVGTLLLMTGNQRFAVWSQAASLTCNLGLTFWLIPRYGIEGAAVASATNLLVWNALMYFFVRKKMNLRTTVFGVF